MSVSQYEKRERHDKENITLKYIAVAVAILAMMFLVGVLLVEGLLSNNNSDSPVTTNTAKAVAEETETSKELTGSAQADEAISATEPDATSNKCLSAEEAWEYIGEYACVVYYVASPYRSGTNTVFLNEKADYKNGFTAVIFANSSVNSGAENTYGYETIEVNGLIGVYQSHPQIVVNNKSQIKIVQ